jgi:hypothetical protein
MSEFWALVDDEFGVGRGRSLVKDQVLALLSYRTAQSALDAGDDLREIWLALCAEMDVPASRHWGRKEPRRQAPARRP